MKIKVYFLILLLCIFPIISCDNNDNNNNEQNNEIQTVMVTFHNTSSYKVIVHRDSFYGPVVTEVDTISRTSSVPIRVNNNNLTVFSMYYIIYPTNDDFNNEYNDVYSSCYDPNMQIAATIKAGQPITIPIPQPSNLVCKSAFVRIINTHNASVRLRYAGSNINQANNILLIAPGQQGLYKFDNIPVTGGLCQNYNIATIFDSFSFSDFVSSNGQYLTKNGYIYYFTFDGNSIIKTGDRALVFN